MTPVDKTFKQRRDGHKQDIKEITLADLVETVRQMQRVTDELLSVNKELLVENRALLTLVKRGWFSR